MKDYLPVGSVVVLKEKTHPIVIIGYKSALVNKKDEVYDYNGAPYPEGLIDNKRSLLFNHKDIDKVLFVGYITKEYRVINNIINIEIDKVKPNKKTGD